MSSAGPQWFLKVLVHLKAKMSKSKHKGSERMLKKRTRCRSGSLITVTGRAAVCWPDYKQREGGHAHTNTTSQQPRGDEIKARTTCKNIQR